MPILSDIAALAKAGYKFDEVKELISMSKNNVSNSDETNEVPEVPETNEVPEIPETASNTDPDYKAMYLETKKELTELQNKNTKTEVDEVSYTIDDIVSNMSKSI